MPAITMTMERRMLFEDNRRRLSRAATIASAVAVILFLVMWVFMPRFAPETPKVVTIEMHQYDLQQVASLAPPPRLDNPPAPNQPLNVHSIPDAEMPRGSVNEPALRRTVEPPLAPDEGKLGRERAEAATTQLASATSRIDRTLMGLDASLHGANGLPDGAHTRRERNVDGGRSEGDLGAYGGRASSGGTTDLGGSRLSASGVAIGTLAPSRGTDAGAEPTADGETGAGSPPGVYRSNASLLAVIQRYAAGIQYCYENELRRDPHLAGKLVVMISIAPSGEVLEARVVSDGVGSSRLTSCAVSQIQEWHFPPVPKGVTTFQTPFVFTPPN